jgi:endonuclease YncB( thermonuclease family)
MLQRHLRIQKALSTGAFFITLLLFTATTPAASGPCPADRINDRVRVVHVYDGDTVKLQDGRHLRFIGVNTPEINRHGKAGQPQAEAARRFLKDLLDKNNNTLLLQYGYERRDHYGRYLAHAFLENGVNVAAELITHGLATTLVIPPNTWGLDCYRRHEKQARIEQLGIWALPAYQSISSTDLQPDEQGFRVVHGQVQRLVRAGRGMKLFLAGPLTLHITGKDMINFRKRELEKLVGRSIEVRGWLKPGHHGLQMRLRHPAWLDTLEPQKKSEVQGKPALAAP